MSTEDDQPSGQKTSSNAAFNQTLNRLALALGKRSKIISTVAKHRANKTAKPPSASSSGISSPRGFSSFTSNPPTTTASSTPPQHNHERKQEDEDDLHLNAPGAGIGYSPSPSPSSASLSAQDRDTAMLRRKVLGKNAARQLAERERKGSGNGTGAGSGGSGSSKKRGAGDESESEEEVGRGALVRRRGLGKGDLPRRKKARVEGAAPGDWVMGDEQGEEGQGKGSVSEEAGKVGEGGDVAMGEAVEKADDGVGEVPQGASQGQTGGERKRKKKNRGKKKKKGAAGSAEVEAAAEAEE